MSKTPQFNAVLNQILNNLQPHTRQCFQCQKDFEVFNEDIEMYKKLQVPPPKLCPDCRMQRRYGFYNNILKFHKKPCEAHQQENVISTFYEKSPYKIFDLKHWWSDKWGAEEYGQNTEFNGMNAEQHGEHWSFFRQFKELMSNVPQPAGTCNEQCTTAFKIIKSELDFYRKMNLPLPRLCPNCRHYQRIKQRNPLKLWHRKCMCNGSTSSPNNNSTIHQYNNTVIHTHGNEPCPNEFETTYSPDRPEIVYCEACYQ